MGQTAGRVAEDGISARTIVVNITNASNALACPLGNLRPDDVGRKIEGAGIPAGATIATRTSATAGTLSANATATTVGVSAEVTATNGPETQGFLGWSPETTVEAAKHTIAGGGGATAQTRVTAPNVPMDRNYSR